MKRLLTTLILIIFFTPIIFQGYTVNFRLYNPYRDNLIITLEYNNTYQFIRGNTSIDLPNVSITLTVYNNQNTYEVFINGQQTTRYIFFPSEVNTINITVRPIFAYINLVINGSGKVIVKFTNGSEIAVNKTTTVKVLQGTFLTLIAHPVNDKFLGWANYSTLNTLWIVAQNSTIVANFGYGKDQSITPVTPQALVGIAFLLIVGGFYLLIKRKKNI